MAGERSTRHFSAFGGVALVIVVFSHLPHPCCVIFYIASHANVKVGIFVPCCVRPNYWPYRRRRVWVLVGAGLSARPPGHALPTLRLFPATSFGLSRPFWMRCERIRLHIGDRFRRRARLPPVGKATSRVGTLFWNIFVNLRREPAEEATRVSATTVLLSNSGIALQI